ncbi:MAG: phosphoribosyl-AMP cyclohydrolase [Motiliproteus sp.]|jgi:phosphoribosyl-AMP cyclohydrolase
MSDQVVSNNRRSTQWLDDIQWTSDGLVAAIAQDYQSGKILMLAWMNRQALELTVREQRAIYWSRSRNRLWRKGEESGHVQELQDIRLDCDSDAILLQVKQLGGIACHTGRQHCFYKALKEGQWQGVEPVIKSPESIYTEHLMEPSDE